MNVGQHMQDSGRGNKQQFHPAHDIRGIGGCQPEPVHVQVLVEGDVSTSHLEQQAGVSLWETRYHPMIFGWWECRVQLGNLCEMREDVTLAQGSLQTPQESSGVCEESARSPQEFSIWSRYGVHEVHQAGALTWVRAKLLPEPRLELRESHVNHWAKSPH